MIKSMTGYGKISKIVNDKKITIEIKSLNSKNFNPYIKIPEAYNEKELEIRNLVFKKLSGGKVNFLLNVETTNNTNKVLNESVINFYYKQLSKIAKQNGLVVEEQNIFQAILKLPDVLKNVENDIDKNEWKLILESIKQALNNIDDFRIQEGKALEIDIFEKVKNIENLIPELKKFEDERIETTSNRIKTKLKEYLGSEENKERFEQEIIYYLDKFDLNEEKTRLLNHCKYFYDTMRLDSSSGTKLGFIAQEMGREINTIGSKANHTEIQKIVVNMKDNLGKIKEQLLNVL